MRPSTTSCPVCETEEPVGSAPCPHGDATRPTSDELSTLRRHLEEARGRRFELISRLSRSNGRDTWKVFDMALDRLAVIKHAPTAETGKSGAESVTYQKLIRQDAKLTARLRHPHLATVHDVIDSDSHVSVIMEFIEGNSVSALRRRGPILAEEAIGQFIQLADVLDHLHRQGVFLTHVDPSHILVDDEAHVTLLNPSESSLNNALDEEFEASMGGFDFPLGELPTESHLRRPDLFNLGCLLYECVSGEDLFGEDESVNRAIAALIVADSDVAGVTPSRTKKNGVEIDPSLLRMLVHLIGADDSQYFRNGAEFIEAARQLRIVSVDVSTFDQTSIDHSSSSTPTDKGIGTSVAEPHSEAGSAESEVDLAAAEHAQQVYVVDQAESDDKENAESIADNDASEQVSATSESLAGDADTDTQGEDASRGDTQDCVTTEEVEACAEGDAENEEDEDQALFDAEAELARESELEATDEPSTFDDVDEPSTDSVSDVGPNDTIAVGSVGTLVPPPEPPLPEAVSDTSAQTDDDERVEPIDTEDHHEADNDEQQVAASPEWSSTQTTPHNASAETSEGDAGEDESGGLDLESLEAARELSSDDETSPEETSEETEEPGERTDPYAQTVMMSAGSLPTAAVEPPPEREYEFQGLLHERALGDVIRDIYVNRRSGTLHVVHQDIERSIYFLKGSIVFASSTLESDWLGDFLIEQGVVERADFDTASAMMQETGDRLGVALVSMGVITDEQLEPLIEDQVANIIYSTFGWEDGEYAFEATGIPLEESITVQISTANTILEGIRRNASAETARNALDDLDRVLSFSENPLLLYQQVALTSEEGFLLSRVDGTTTASEAASLSPLGEDDTLRSIYALVSAGVVELLDADDERKATPASLSAADLPKPDTDANTQSAPTESKEPTEEQRAIYEDIGNKHASLATANYYQLLEVSESSSRAEIKAAYYKMVKKYHPDGHHALQSLDVQGLLEDLLTKITDAYEILHDEEERENYDGKNGTQQKLTQTKPVDQESPNEPPQSSEERAQALYQEGRRHYHNLAYFDAIQCLRESIRLDENNGDGFKLLAMALRKNPNWVREAATHFNRALVFDADDIDCYLQLGDIYDESGLSTRAKRMFQKVMELDPVNERASLWLADH